MSNIGLLEKGINCLITAPKRNMSMQVCDKFYSHGKEFNCKINIVLRENCQCIYLVSSFGIRQ